MKRIFLSFRPLSHSGLQCTRQLWNGRSRIFVTLLAALAISGCKYEFPEPFSDYGGGTLSIESVVFIGDDFLSGFMDGALYTEGQENGVSSSLAQAFTGAGMIEPFVQAGISSVDGYNVYASDSVTTVGKYVLVYEGWNATDPARTITPGESVSDFTGDRTALNDLSVPFLKSFQVNRPVTNDNEYYSRIIINSGSESLLTQATNHHPGAFVIWIGMSDILNYAIAGGIGDSIPPADPSLIGKEDLTPLSLFRSSLEDIVSELLSDEATNGIIFTLPAFDDLPFFYYYPYNYMKLEPTKLGLANSFYSSFNEAVAENNMTPGNPKRPFISFNDNGITLYPQPMVVEDHLLPDAFYPDGTTPLPKIRNMKEGELVLMTFPVDEMDQGYGWITPISEKYYLNLSQVQTLHDRIDRFNEAIIDVAGMYPDRLAVVDIRDKIHAIAETGKLNGWGTAPSSEEYSYDGVPLTARFELYSIYSLDGLHFNQRGSAYISGMAVSVINQFFQTRLPGIDVNNFKGNVPEY